MRKQRPPRLRTAKNPKRTCHVCKYMNRISGLCTLFKYPVKRDQTCDRWTA